MLCTSFSTPARFASVRSLPQLLKAPRVPNPMTKTALDPVPLDAPSVVGFDLQFALAVDIRQVLDDAPCSLRTPETLTITSGRAKRSAQAARSGLRKGDHAWRHLDGQSSAGRTAAARIAGRWDYCARPVVQLQEIRLNQGAEAVQKRVIDPLHPIYLYATRHPGMTPALEQLRHDLQSSCKRGQFADGRAQRSKLALGQGCDAPQVRTHQERHIGRRRNRAGRGSFAQ